MSTLGESGMPLEERFWAGKLRAELHALEEVT
jgi:hypothetical protein